MIAGLSSSGIATAIRTAGQARERMDTAARQIATGQRVASVKDDGAAWSRAAELRAEKPQWQVRQDTIARSELALAGTQAWVDLTLSALNQLGELLLAARATQPGSSARAAIAAEWNQVTEQTSAINAGNNNPGMTGVTAAEGWVGGGYDLMLSGDTFFGPDLLSVWPNGASFHSWFGLVDGLRPVALRGFDIANATTATLDLARTSITSLTTAATNWTRNIGADQVRMERLRDHAERGAARADRQIGALSDADLGAASANLRQNETRQQLALSTVRQALGAYGAFAGGLLGNVQRTQRSILA